MTQKLFLFIILVGISKITHSQDHNKQIVGFDVKAYVDAYWQTRFSNDETQVSDRVFVTNSENFSIGNINAKISKELGQFGAVGQFGFGPRAEASNDEDFPEIQQLYVYWDITDKFKLTFGEFDTFIGYEVIDAPNNFHYSTSNLFQNGPFFHTGLKLDIDLGNGFGIMTAYLDETDDINDVDSGNTNFGAQASYQKEDKNIFINFIYGGATVNTVLEEETNIDRGQIDLVADLQKGKYYFALNASYQFISVDDVEGKNPDWFGIATYAQREITDFLSAGIRLEYLSDDDQWIGSWGENGEVFSATVTVPFNKDDLQFVPELRFDAASNSVYQGDNTQLTLGAAVIYSF